MDELYTKLRKEKRNPTPDEQALIDEVEKAREIIIQVHSQPLFPPSCRTTTTWPLLPKTNAERLVPSLQVDAFPALGQESQIKGWVTEDRPALQVSERASHQLCHDAVTSTAFFCRRDGLLTAACRR